MVTKVIYARLYNLGNYENERLEVEVTVEDNGAEAVAGAWEDARQVVEDQHAALEAARAEERQRQQEEYDRRREEAMAARKAPKQTTRGNSDDDPIF